MTQLSVVICSHNPREDFILRVLRALQAQTLPPTNWELLLVDNRSNDPLAQRFDISWHLHGRHVREEELGLTAARLRGIRESTGDVLVFVDDDNVLSPGYLENAVAIGLQFPFIGAWGGSSLPEEGLEIPSWALRHRWRIALETVTEDIWSNLREGFLTTPAGAGMCIRRSVGLRFGEWCSFRRESKLLDRTGTTLAGYGDADLAHCALDLGFGTGKTTKLCLTHLIPPSRLTLDYFVRHAEADATSFMMFRAIRGLPIDAPKSSLVANLRTRLHFLFSDTPPELRKIHEAHEKGRRRGWSLAQEFLRFTNSNAPNGLGGAQHISALEV